MVILKVVKKTLVSFLEDDAFSLSASLAFYTLLSLSPLLVILLSFAGFIGPETQSNIVRQIESVVGGKAGEIIEIVIQNAYQHQVQVTVSALAGIIVMVFAATSVFVNLQKNMNKIWNIEVVKGTRFKNFLRKRIISFFMVLAIGLILLLSVTINAVLEHIFKSDGMIWYFLNEIVSISMYVFVFALLIKFIPDIVIQWREVLIGASITALLFKFGELIISRYITYKGMGSSYGAAGSLVIFLFWVYYSSLIVFLGAELTQEFTKEVGSNLHPSDRAEWSEKNCQNSNDREI